jgi:hypothetical protein
MPSVTLPVAALPQGRLPRVTRMHAPRETLSTVQRIDAVASGLAAYAPDDWVLSLKWDDLGGQLRRRGAAGATRSPFATRCSG